MNTLKNTTGSDVLIVGRETERCLLENIYTNGRSSGQVAWISGASGVGKSALIQSFLQDKKNVCSGKFDFLKSSVPYSVITKILDELCSLLEVEHVFVNIGPEVISILSKLLPQIRNVITQLDFEGGLDTIVEGKNGEWGFQKLKQATRLFVEAAIDVISFASKLPVIFYFDDLQWTDEASLEIIRALFDGTDAMKQFFCIISYRDNEVDEDGAVGICKAFINESKYNCTEISIGNLSFDDVTTLITSLLNMTQSQSEHLGRLVYDITRGNAFFVRRYLQHLMKNRLVRHSEDTVGWEIDEVTIRNEVDGGEDISYFIAHEINNLPSPASTVLKVASLLGQEVDVALLELVLDALSFDSSKSPFTTILDFLESKCLIVTQSDKKKFSFVHDRIHQAVYSLSYQEHDLQQLLRRIGRTILDIEVECQSVTPEIRLLLAVDLLNRGRSHEDTYEGKDELAQLNLKAAKEVLRFSAFKLSQNYLEISLRVLGNRCWELHYGLTLKISNVLASVLLSNGLMSEALQLIDRISAHCRCVEDRHEGQIVKLEIFACTNQLDKCLEASQTILSELRFSRLPQNPGLSRIIPAVMKVKRLLTPLSSDDILTLPDCNDSRVLLAMKIFGIMCPVAFFVSRESMIPIIACRMMHLSLKYGLTGMSPYALSCFGVCMTTMLDFKEAFRLGELAIRLMGRFGEDARTLVIVYGLTYHTRRHIVDVFKPTLRAYYVSFIQGDLAFSGQAIAMHLLARMIAGASLEHIINDTFSFSRQLEAYDQRMMWNILLIAQRSNLELADRSTEIIKLIGIIPDDDTFYTYIMGADVEFHDFLFSILTLRSRYIVGERESALLFARKCWLLKGIKAAIHYCIVHFFYSALVALECWKEHRGAKRFRFWRIFCKFERLLKLWTTKGNPNTLHLVTFLSAECLASKERSDFQAVQEAYHEAITQATRCGFIQDAALGNEHLGKYCLRKCDNELAAHYLERAKLLYFDWGAFQKVNRMSMEYGNFLRNEISSDSLSAYVTGRARQGIVSEIEGVRARTRLSIDDQHMSTSSDLLTERVQSLKESN